MQKKKFLSGPRCARFSCRRSHIEITILCIQTPRVLIHPGETLSISVTYYHMLSFPLPDLKSPFKSGNGQHLNFIESNLAGKPFFFKSKLYLGSLCVCVCVWGFVCVVWCVCVQQVYTFAFCDPCSS